ncbi:unnamed protein product, partial [Tetraodon nigroviridis]
MHLVNSQCYLLDGISKGAWLNRSSIIFAGNDKWSVDPRVSIVSGVGDKHEYSLQITKVDVTDDGLYTCSIQSERSPRPKLLNLIVKAILPYKHCVAMAHNLLPPKIYDISSDITVNEGSNMSLICTASGKPEPIISWRHITPSARWVRKESPFDLLRLLSAPRMDKCARTQSNREVIVQTSGLVGEESQPTSVFPLPVVAGCLPYKVLSSGRKYDSGEHLNITSITRDQAGKYECSALNDIASPDTKTVKVTVNFAPTIHEIKSHGIGLGRNALLRCEAAAVPAPTYEWYKSEKRISNGQGIEIKNLSSRSVLTVNNMTEDHFGNYTCVATNKLGMANASVSL